MKPISSLGAVALVFVAAAPPAHAQLEAASIRGTVTDEAGKPLPDVKVEIEYKGETRTRIVRTLSTDKKGAYIRVGLRTGPWSATFRKDGYRPKTVETYLSGGGVSEIPPLALSPAEPALAAATAAPGAELPAAADKAEAERARELSATYQKALDALRAGRHEEAETLFRTVSTELPTLAEARYNLGYLAVRRKDDAAAEPEFRKAIELQPGMVDASIALASLLDRTKRGEEALALLQGASDRFASDGRFQFALGAAAFNLSRNEVAEAAFRKAAELDPANAEVQFFLGSLALGRNDVPAALAHLETYVASAPGGAENLEPARALIETLKARKQ